MTKFIVRAGWLSLALILALSLPAQDAAKAGIPDNVATSLDGLQKTRTSNGIFNIKFQNAYFWALEKSVYVNLVFTADLDADAVAMKEAKKKEYDEWVAGELKKLEEINKKIKKEEEKKKWEPPAPNYPPAYHNLYMRVVKGSQVMQEYRSPILADNDKSEYFSFGTVLEPGEYDVLVDINRIDNTQDGTQIFTITVPALTVMDIMQPREKLDISTPVFYGEVKQLMEAEQRFTVVKNKYQIGPAMQEFVPWGDRPFKNSDRPILTFFVLGAVAVQSAEPWNISATLQIHRGKETVAKFESLKLVNPYFYQPIEFVKKEKDATSPLPAGDYTLSIELKDNNQGGKAKGSFDIPFKIIE
jgi:hypothetical protein